MWRGSAAAAAARLRIDLRVIAITQSISVGEARDRRSDLYGDERLRDPEKSFLHNICVGEKVPHICGIEQIQLMQKVVNVIAAFICRGTYNMFPAREAADDSSLPAFWQKMDGRKHHMVFKWEPAIGSLDPVVPSYARDLTGK